MFKLADVLTPLQPHQERALEKFRASHGLLALHGVGSGKTLEYIAGHDATGLPADFVVPAPLQQNLQKEFLKHTGEIPEDVRIRSYEKATRDGGIDPTRAVFFDEAHRGRNTGTGASKMLRQARSAPYRMLGTGTGVYNQPTDIAGLLNAAAGSEVVPDNPSKFKGQFIGEKTITPGFLNRLRGMKPMTIPTLKNRDALIDAATGYVDVHRGGTGPDFPTRIDESFEVPMSDKQVDLYRYHEGQMPWYLKAKIHHGLPMSKQEMQELNAFQGALRQTSNTPRPYIDGMTDEEEDAHTPKIQKAVANLAQMHKENPNFRGVVYSNYIGAGLKPYSRKLTELGIAHNLFTGETRPEDRARYVNEYNSGKAPVLLISGAGSEGLDLKGTRAVQLLEPHWNNSRGEQAVGRGIRYKSHAHLPESERNVRVQKYYSVHPKSFMQRIGIGKPDSAVERYMDDMSNQKSQLSDEIMKALQEASDKGPLNMNKTATTLGQVAVASSLLGAASGAQASPGHRVRGALLGVPLGLAGATAGIPLQVPGALAGAGLAPQALRFFNQEDDMNKTSAAFQFGTCLVSSAFEFGEKLAALDPSKLPEGVNYSSPYEMKWKTPGGHSVTHAVSPHTVDFGSSMGGDHYYKALADEIAKRNQLVDEDAPGHLQAEASAKRFGNGLLGGTLGGLGGMAGGALLSHLTGHDTGNGAFLGGALGTLGGAVAGAWNKVKPRASAEYDSDYGIPGGMIGQLYQEDPHMRRLREAHEQLKDDYDELRYNRYSPYHDYY